jgi:hypothetical protein
VNTLYAADLVGAAGGCVLLVPALEIMDGPTAVFLVASLAALGGVCFALEAAARRAVWIAFAVTVLLGMATAGHTVLANRQTPLLRLVWVKGQYEEQPRYEKWNSFSRVVVTGSPDQPLRPLGWGISRSYPRTPEVALPQLRMDIDACASTMLTQYSAGPDKLQFLKYDITNLVHHLRPNADVFVIGTGGGRDVLSALVFDQRSALGVEINRNILTAANGEFGDFTGHLDRDPRVRFVNDEARSYLARQPGRFDIIQISLIDTWAATAAGAFTLTENSLYTVEAWQLFLDRLTPRGVLSVSRWYHQDRPDEVYRLTELGAQALRAQGVQRPRAHLALLRTFVWQAGEILPDGVGTMLVSREPFTREDVARLRKLAKEMQFDLMLSPSDSLDPNLDAIVSPGWSDEFVAEYPLNISAPTDDSPFFFHMVRFRDMLHPGKVMGGGNRRNASAVVALLGLLVTVVALTLLCIVLPLLLRARGGVERRHLPLLLFFVGIGAGFMLVEISQMQRLVVFLGHPTYGLTVVLFSLLLSSGIGSSLSGGQEGPGARRRARWRMVALLVMLTVFGLVTPHLTTVYRSAPTPARILVAVAVLFPMGLFMGMPFPLGLRLAAREAAALTPWLWGINGATSVCASVVAVAIALHTGITSAFWAGAVCYLLAFLAYLRASARCAHEPPAAEAPQAPGTTCDPAQTARVPG